MRVITGIAGGRKLKELEGKAVRPTTDMVKEAIFNIIQFDIEGRKVLDLFAGTGQLGIEALSRGAKSAVFVDESAAAVKIIRENLENTGLSALAKLVQGDAGAFLSRCEKFDIVFLDPPYNTGLLEKCLRKTEEFDILSEGGIIVCESKVGKTLPELSAPYRRLKQYRYGKILITTFRRDTV